MSYESRQNKPYGAETSEKEKKRKEDYQYTDIRIRTTKTFPNRFQIYVPTSFLQPFLKGLGAFKVHGQSASKNIVQFVVRYGEVHGRGNPQLLMETFVNPEAPSPMHVFCMNLAGVINDGRIYCRKAGESARTGGGAWIQGLRCYSCKDNQLRKGAKR